MLPAPCPPTLLNVTSSCDSDNITVSWHASQGALSYRAVAEASNGSSLQCTTSSLTYCQISGLLCGQQYEIYVIGMDANCAGASSLVYLLQTGKELEVKVKWD